jgi:benzoylformate decarboxylase
MGPVFVALPMDVLDAPVQEDVVPTPILRTRVAPQASEVAEIASILAAAARPLIIMGDGIAASGAQAELARVAEHLGAEVWGADSSEVNMSQDHPLFAGLLGHMFGEHSRPLTSRADAVLICGTYVFPEVFPELGSVFAQGAQVIHIDLDDYEIAKNFPVDIGVVADPKATLGLLAAQLEHTMTAHQKHAAQERVTQLGAAKQHQVAAERGADAAVRDAVPMHAARFMEELAGQLPADAVIFDEALTNSPDLVRYLPPNESGQYFQTRGGSLGVGVPGALGLKLANPDKTVVGFSGDGGSMYTIQSLWTAAHHNIGAKFVICNNHSYRILKYNIQQYWRERHFPERDFPASFDIKHPDIRFAEIAQGMGVHAMRVERPDQVGPAIERALGHDGPFLIDLVITDEVPSHFVYPKCGQ